MATLKDVRSLARRQLDLSKKMIPRHGERSHNPKFLARHKESRRVSYCCRSTNFTLLEIYFIPSTRDAIKNRKVWQHSYSLCLIGPCVTLQKSEFGTQK